MSPAQDNKTSPRFAGPCPRCGGAVPREGAPPGDDADLGVVYPILRFFATAHLSADLAATSSRFMFLAVELANNLPRCEETSAALRKLLEAKDCAVRATLLARIVEPADEDNTDAAAI